MYMYVHVYVCACDLGGYLLTADSEESVNEFSIGRCHAFKGGVTVLGDV